MRLNRTTLLLLFGSLGVILVALLLINLPVSAPESETPMPGEAISGPVFADPDSTGISQLSLTQADGTSLLLSRDDAGWRFETEAYADREVDVAVLQANLDRLPDLRYSDQFAAQNLAVYGLDAPGFTLSIRSGESSESFALGNLNPGETRYYALRNDDSETVYLLTPTSVLDALKSLIANPPLLALPTPRPQPVLNIPGPIFNDFNQADLSRFTLTDSDGASLNLLRSAMGDWVIDPAEAEAAELDSLLASASIDLFGFLRAVDAIEGASLEPLGLAEPALTIEAETVDGRIYRLRTGIEDPTGTRVYALVNDFDTVAVLNEAEIAELRDLLLSPPLMAAEDSPTTESP